MQKEAGEGQVLPEEGQKEVQGDLPVVHRVQGRSGMSVGRHRMLRLPFPLLDSVLELARRR